MSEARLCWELKELTAYTALCPHCGEDLLEGDEYACWVQPEGVEAALEEQDFCRFCDEPITERGYEIQDDNEEDAT